ncbi:MAG: helix-turn-helix domain-containing protein [Lachnospiraceae bacterium]|nr:helix-turn-helix domain-containing protein [Lachnospiraceae bacterium]
MNDKSLYTRSVERAIDILECFIERDSLSLHEIAEATSLPDSTALRIINSLRKRGYLMRMPHTKNYCLGDRFLQFTSPGNSVKNRLQNISQTEMQSLFQRYNENLQLFTFNGSELCCLIACESTQTSHPPIYEESRKWYPCAAGRVFLAYQDEEKQHQLDPEGLVEKDTLAKILEDGYTLCVGPDNISIVEIAAPIFGFNQSLQAVLQLSGPASRLVNEKILDKLEDTAHTAQTISSQLADGVSAATNTQSLQ